MSTFTSSDGTVVITPSIVTTMNLTYATGNVEHDTLAPGTTVTSISGGYWKGQAEAVVADVATAQQLAVTVTDPTEFVDDIRFPSGIVITATGDVTLTLDDDSRDAYVVAFDWVEQTS